MGESFYKVYVYQIITMHTLNILVLFVSCAAVKLRLTKK